MYEWVESLKDERNRIEKKGETKEEGEDVEEEGKSRKVRGPKKKKRRRG